MEKKMINMTPHPVNIVDENKSVIKVILPSGNLIRLSSSTKDSGFSVDDVKITKTIFGNPQGLPEENLGTYYIVSQIVKSAFPNRQDLLVPAEMIRDDQGNIIGCKSLGI